MIVKSVLLLVGAVVLLGFAIEAKMQPERPGHWGWSFVYSAFMTGGLLSYAYFLREWL
jgi:hypothetical protein